MDCEIIFTFAIVLMYDAHFDLNDNEKLINF